MKTEIRCENCKHYLEVKNTRDCDDYCDDEMSGFEPMEEEEL
jgi:hypothetical protein